MLEIFVNSNGLLVSGTPCTNEELKADRVNQFFKHLHSRKVSTEGSLALKDVKIHNEGQQTSFEFAYVSCISLYGYKGDSQYNDAWLEE